jgi:four helix bundle protein
MQKYNSKLKVDIRKRTYHYALDIIKFIDQLPKNDMSCQVISKQLLRSATSIGANIIEAQASSSKKDFTNFLNYSSKPANESKFWLGLLRDSGKISADLVNPLINETKELSNILGASILTLKGRRK